MTITYEIAKEFMMDHIKLYEQLAKFKWNYLKRLTLLIWTFELIKSQNKTIKLLNKRLKKAQEIYLENQETIKNLQLKIK